MQRTIITNNPLVLERAKDVLPVEFLEAYGYFEVLNQVRLRIHSGYTLETHPLSGSVKPNETPYKSVIVKAPQTERPPVEFQSLQLIEAAIETWNKFQVVHALPDWPDRVLRDFQVVDWNLLYSALTQMGYTV